MVDKSWWPDWRGQRCAVVASGPSIAGQSINGLIGRARTVAVNNSWKLAPWADVLYACDENWWRTGMGDGFGGIKVGHSDYPGVQPIRIRRQGVGWCNDILLDDTGEIGSGASSAFQALNLAVRFGSRDVALLGCDGRIDQGSHWHGDHVEPLKNPDHVTAALWVEAMDGAAHDLRRSGVDVTNCSPVSALTEYPKMSLDDWLAKA